MCSAVRQPHTGAVGAVSRFGIPFSVNWILPSQRVVKGRSLFFFFPPFSFVIVFTYFRQPAAIHLRAMMLLFFFLESFFRYRSCCMQLYYGCPASSAQTKSTHIYTHIHTRTRNLLYLAFFFFSFPPFYVSSSSSVRFFFSFLLISVSTSLPYSAALWVDSDTPVHAKEHRWRFAKVACFK